MPFVEYRRAFSFGLVAGIVVFLGWKLANDRVTWDYLYELRQGPAQPELRETIRPRYEAALDLCESDPVAAMDEIGQIELDHGFVLMDYWTTRRLYRCIEREWTAKYGNT